MSKTPGDIARALAKRMEELARMRATEAIRPGLRERCPAVGAEAAFLRAAAEEERAEIPDGRLH